MVNNVTKIIAYTGAKLLKPCASNGVFLHCWSPGYKIVEKINDSNGVEKTQKKFIPTGTFEAALAHLKNEYGTKEYLKFKADAHPGHVSVETSTSYLSVGTNVEMHVVGIKTQHPISFVRKFEIDLISFARVPEKIIDFYTLDSPQINAIIDEFNNAQRLYSLFGNRLYKNEGESCATSAFIALEAGGIESLLSVDQWALTKYGILTPSLLTSYSTKARDQEQLLSSDSVSLSAELLPEKRKYAEKIVTNYLSTFADDKQNNISNEPNQRGPSS